MTWQKEDEKSWSVRAIRIHYMYVWNCANFISKSVVCCKYEWNWPLYVRLSKDFTNLTKNL